MTLWVLNYFLSSPVSVVYLEDSFIKSGVFSVAELVRVSRSKYPPSASSWVLWLVDGASPGVTLPTPRVRLKATEDSLQVLIYFLVMIVKLVSFYIYFALLPCVGFTSESSIHFLWWKCKGVRLLLSILLSLICIGDSKHDISINVLQYLKSQIQTQPIVLLSPFTNSSPGCCCCCCGWSSLAGSAHQLLQKHVRPQTAALSTLGAIFTLWATWVGQHAAQCFVKNLDWIFWLFCLMHC